MIPYIILLESEITDATPTQASPAVVTAIPSQLYKYNFLIFSEISKNS